MSNTKQVALRLEPDFHERVQLLAKDQHRSLHAQVVFILESYFDVQLLRRRVEELERERS